MARLYRSISNRSKVAEEVEGVRDDCGPGMMIKLRLVESNQMVPRRVVAARDDVLLISAMTQQQWNCREGAREAEARRWKTLRRYERRGIRGQLDDAVDVV